MLNDDRLWELWNAQGTDDMSQAEAMRFARAIEAEVRKDDEALIRKMRNALYALPLPYTSETRAALQAANEWLDAAIATRARLEKAQ